MITPFSHQDIAARAGERLLSQVPREGVDITLRAPRSDGDLSPGLMEEAAIERPRLAAVLVPLVKREPEATVLFTQRTEHLPSHPGQVAFPGGKIDHDDDGAVEAALRETEEETNLLREFVTPIGFLDAYQTRTGYRVIPVVSLVETGFQLRPEPGEVADIFEVPLRFLMDPANHRIEARMWQGAERRFYAMPYQERYIWGATAGMVKNLYERLYDESV